MAYSSKAQFAYLMYATQTCCFAGGGWSVSAKWATTTQPCAAARAWARTSISTVQLVAASQTSVNSVLNCMVFGSIYQFFRINTNPSGTQQSNIACLVPVLHCMHAIAIVMHSLLDALNMYNSDAARLCQVVLRYMVKSTLVAVDTNASLQAAVALERHVTTSVEAVPWINMRNTIQHLVQNPW